MKEALRYWRDLPQEEKDKVDKPVTFSMICKLYKKNIKNNQ